MFVCFFGGSWTCSYLGNETADRAAKEALDKKPTDDPMPFSDPTPSTAKYIHQVWQKEWDDAVVVLNELREILEKVWDKLVLFCKTRKADSSK